MPTRYDVYLLCLAVALLALLLISACSALAQPYPTPTAAQVLTATATATPITPMPTLPVSTVTTTPEQPSEYVVYLPVVFGSSGEPVPPTPIPTPTPPVVDEPVVLLIGLNAFGGAGIHAVEDGAGTLWIATVGTSRPELDPFGWQQFKARLFRSWWREPGQPTIELTNELRCGSEARPTINSNGQTLIWGVPAECFQTIPAYVPVGAAMLQSIPAEAVPWPFGDDDRRRLEYAAQIRTLRVLN